MKLPSLVLNTIVRQYILLTALDVNTVNPVNSALTKIMSSSAGVVASSSSTNKEHGTLPQALDMLLGLPSGWESQDGMKDGNPKEKAQTVPLRYVTRECPRCHHIIPTVGSQFWVHFRKCDPVAFSSILRAGGEGLPTDGEGSIGMEELFARTVHSDVPDDAPLVVARKEALERFEQRNRIVTKIFDMEKVAEIDNMARSDEERRLAILQEVTKCQ